MQNIKTKYWFEGNELFFGYNNNMTKVYRYHDENCYLF